MLIFASDADTVRHSLNDERCLAWHGQAWRQAFEQALAELEGEQPRAADMPDASSAGSRSVSSRPADVASMPATAAAAATRFLDRGTGLVHAETRPMLLPGSPYRAIADRPGQTHERSACPREGLAVDRPVTVQGAWSAVSRTSAPAMVSHGWAPKPAGERGAVGAHAGEQPGSTHLFLERTAGGAVLWVRDTATPHTPLHAALVSIVREAEARGMPIAAIRLNGAAYPHAVGAGAREFVDPLRYGEQRPVFISIDPSEEP